MTVTATGATVDFGCDSGTIDQPLVLDQSRRVSARGTYAFGQGGPREPGGPPAVPHPARYDGATDGKTLQLTVFIVDLSRTIGDFLLVASRQGSLDRCL
jgi:hypothetical protein